MCIPIYGEYFSTKMVCHKTCRKNAKWRNFLHGSVEHESHNLFELCDRCNQFHSMKLALVVRSRLRILLFSEIRNHKNEHLSDLEEIAKTKSKQKMSKKRVYV